MYARARHCIAGSVNSLSMSCIEGGLSTEAKPNIGLQSSGNLAAFEDENSVLSVAQPDLQGGDNYRVRLHHSNSLRDFPRPSSAHALRRVVTLPDMKRHFSAESYREQVLKYRAYDKSWAESLRSILDEHNLSRLDPEQTGYKYPVVLGDKGQIFELINQVSKRTSEDVCRTLGIDVRDDFMFGEGSCGTVRLARDLESKGYYAVKRVNKFRIGGELAVLEALPAHGSVVRTVDYALAPCREGWENYHLFMPIAECGDGERFIRKWKSVVDHLDAEAQEEVLAYISYQILQGLEAMHEQGVAHLDIKPANLLFFADGRVALCDYSTSEIVEGLSTQQNGTTIYMAPEQVLAETRSYDSKAADLWMLGVTLLEMFDFQHPTEQRRIKGPYEPSMENIKEVPYLLKCVDPEKRLSIDELKQAPCMLSEEQRARGAALLKEVMRTTC